MNSLRLAVRSLSRMPGFAALAVVTLALGIGANTAVFSMAEAPLLRTLPVHDSGLILLFRFTISSIEDTLRRSVAARKLNMTLLLMFAATALALAAIRLYGTLSFGAQPRDILGMLRRDGAVIVGTGLLLIGGIGAFGLTRWMRTLLFGIEPLDTITFTAAPVLLAAVALVACLVPARRAARTDPMTALRYE